MYDAAALGELLIDFTPIGSGAGTGSLGPCFEQNAGGAPANVLVTAAGFGLHTCFIGKVGNDPFGHFLESQLSQHGVDVRGLRFTNTANTTLAFVHIDESGDREFSFYRNPGADTTLSMDDVDLSLIKGARLFHFGSLSLSHNPARNTTYEVVRAARDYHACITFDPNLRLSLWSSEAEARETILHALEFVDVLKVSEEELRFLTDVDDLNQAMDILLQTFPLSLILVTLGPHGCRYRSKSVEGNVSGFPVLAVDTTGAGDAFMGAFIAGLLELNKRPEQLSATDLDSLLQVANACGALTTTKRGGIPALPSKQAVAEFLRSLPD